MAKKSLLIDIQKWTEEPNWGIPVFTYNLVKNFIALNKDEYFDLYFLQDIMRKKPAYGLANKNINRYKELLKYYVGKFGIMRSGADYIYSRFKKARLNDIYNEESKKGKAKFDAVYMPNAGYYFPPFKTGKMVSTVHDIAGMDTIKNIGQKIKNYLPFSERKRVESESLKNIKRSDIITTVSNYTKSRIIELIGIDENKVKIVPCGVNIDVFKPVKDKIAIKAYLNDKHNIDRPFILYVGAIQPRKNVKGLLDAYFLSEKLRKELDFVIVTGQIWKSKDELKAIYKSRYSKNIHLIRNARAEELPLFYSAAEIFAYPSFYEGFGMPLLEAFACGVPVAASDRTSLPEVGGEAAVYFNPYDLGNISQTLENLAFNEGLKSKLVNKGFDRVKEFTWEGSAKKLYNILI